MEISRELIENCVELLNLAFNAEGDVFGKMHNTACDVVNALEVLLVEGAE